MKVALSICLCGVLVAVVAMPSVQAGTETTTLSSTTTTRSAGNSSQHDPLSGQSSETSSASSKAQHHETLQSTESFHSNRQQMPSERNLYQEQQQQPKASTTAAGGSAGQSASAGAQGKEQYDTSQMIQTPSHFTFVSNQQVSPGHVTMIGYTTPIVKAGGYIRVPDGEGGKAVVASNSPSVAAPAPLAHPADLHNVHPLASSPPGENTLNDIQSQLMQFTSNSIYTTSEAQQKLQQQQMAKLIEAAALAAEKAPIRGLQGLVGSATQAQSPTGAMAYYQMPQAEMAERQSQQQPAAVHELAEDFPSKMNYKNYEQHTRLPYRVQSEEEAKNTGAFSAPLDKPKPFMVYKPGYDKIANLEQQGGFQPVLPSPLLGVGGGGGRKPLTIIADKEVSVIGDVSNELTSGGPPRSIQYLNIQSPTPATQSEIYGQRTSPAKASPYPKLPPGYESLAVGRPSLEPSSFMTTNPKGMPLQATLSSSGYNHEVHHPSYPRASPGQHFHQQSPQSMPSHSRPLEYNFGQSQKLQLEPPGGRSTALHSSPNEEQATAGAGGGKYDPKAELLNQINFMLTNSPNLSDESRNKHRGTIENTLRHVEETLGGSGGKAAKLKMLPEGVPSGNHFGRYREMFTQEEPVKLVSQGGTKPIHFSEPVSMHHHHHHPGGMLPPGLSMSAPPPPPPSSSAAIQQVYPPSPHHVSPHHQHHHHHQAPPPHYTVPAQANAPVKYDDFPSEHYQGAPQYGGHLKSDRLQQKIQQFLNEQMFVEEKKNVAGVGPVAGGLSPHLLAGTPQAAYMQKYSAKLNNYGKLQMMAPAGTQALTIDSNLLVSKHHPAGGAAAASPVGLAARYPSSLKVTDPSSAYATYFSQEQRAGSGNPYRSPLTADQLKPVRGNSEWWKETSAEPKPSNYYQVLQ